MNPINIFIAFNEFYSEVSSQHVGAFHPLWFLIEIPDCSSFRRYTGTNDGYQGDISGFELINVNLMCVTSSSLYFLF